MDSPDRTNGQVVIVEVSDPRDPQTVPCPPLLERIRELLNHGYKYLLQAAQWALTGG